MRYDVIGIAPLACQERTGFPINDVVAETEKDVILGPGSLELVFVPERKDVVPHNVVSAVVDMVPAVFGVIHGLFSSRMPVLPSSLYSPQPP